MFITALALTLSALGTPAAAPNPEPAPETRFDPTAISADALWVIHFDLQQLVGSSLFDLLSAQLGTDWSGESLAAWISAQSGGSADEPSLIEKYNFEPLEDLLSITVYGESDDEDAAVLLIRTTSRIEATLERLHADYEQFGFHGASGRRLHTLGDNGDSVFLYVHTDQAQRGSRATESGERTLVLGAEVPQVLEAIGVLEKSAVGLESSMHEVMRQIPDDDAILWIVAAQDPEQWSWDLDSTVAAKAQNAKFQLGEHDGDLFIEAAVGTRTTEDAADIVTTLQGLQAMVRLLGPSGVEGQYLNEVLGNLLLYNKGPRVELEFDMATSRILEIADSLAQQHGGWKIHSRVERQAERRAELERRRAERAAERAKRNRKSL